MKEIIYYLKKIYKNDDDPDYPFVSDSFYYLVPGSDVDEVLDWDCYGVGVLLDRLPGRIANAMWVGAEMISGGFDEIEVKKEAFVNMIKAREDFRYEISRSL